MNYTKIIFLVSGTLIYAVAIKAMLGFHFPWERCDCCGKKYRDHQKKIPTKWI